MQIEHNQAELKRGLIPKSHLSTCCTVCEEQGLGLSVVMWLIQMLHMCISDPYVGETGHSFSGHSRFAKASLYIKISSESGQICRCWSGKPLNHNVHSMNLPQAAG